MVFFLIFPGFLLKVFIFWTIFSLKLSLRLKTMLSSIKTLKRYCKATLNVFFNKKNLMMAIKFYLYDRFFVSNQNLPLNLSKLLKFLGFFSELCSKFFHNI